MVCYTIEVVWERQCEQSWLIRYINSWTRNKNYFFLRIVSVLVFALPMVKKWNALLNSTFSSRAGWLIWPTLPWPHIAWSLARWIISSSCSCESPCNVNCSSQLTWLVEARSITVRCKLEQRELYRWRFWDQSRLFQKRCIWSSVM